MNCTVLLEGTGRWPIHIRNSHSHLLPPSWPGWQMHLLWPQRQHRPMHQQHPKTQLPHLHKIQICSKGKCCAYETTFQMPLENHWVVCCRSQQLSTYSLGTDDISYEDAQINCLPKTQKDRLQPPQIISYPLLWDLLHLSQPKWPWWGCIVTQKFR